MQNLKNMYKYYYELAKETYENNKDEIDSIGTSKHNSWYELLIHYLQNYRADVDCDEKIFLKTMRHGDIIDIECYRGTGLYMIYLDAGVRSAIKKDDVKFISMESYDVLPTLGDFGHILPEPGFSLVKEFGLAYFYGTEISGFQISNLRKIKLKIDQGEGEGEYHDMYFEKPVYFETSLDMELDSEEMDEVIIDGVYLYGYLTDKFL